MNEDNFILMSAYLAKIDRASIKPQSKKYFEGLIVELRNALCDFGVSFDDESRKAIKARDEKNRNAAKTDGVNEFQIIEFNKKFNRMIKAARKVYAILTDERKDKLKKFIAKAYPDPTARKTKLRKEE
jgi:TRAP-type C4-dicarboxylate transport system substrate-binding protein